MHVLSRLISSSRLHSIFLVARRKLLERLIKTIEPSAQLLSFGSTANGFELKNSGKASDSLYYLANAHPTRTDMDLCCILEPRPDQPTSASQFVLRAAQLLERETKFAVKPLPNARMSPGPPPRLSNRKSLTRLLHRNTYNQTHPSTVSKYTFRNCL